MGESSEGIFRSVTGAIKPENKKIGDAVLQGHVIEVKAVGGGTLNQVRAVKYSVLVAHDTSSDEWYVVPPHEVVRLVSKKARGQHTENPFESATIAIKSLQPHKISGPSALLSATRAAIAAGQQHPKVKAAMAQVLKESIELAQKSKDAVAKAFEPEESTE